MSLPCSAGLWLGAVVEWSLVPRKPGRRPLELAWPPGRRPRRARPAIAVGCSQGGATAPLDHPEKRLRPPCRA
eukprot:10734731-Alexandrium_andersonii.AAC.1